MIKDLGDRIEILLCQDYVKKISAVFPLEDTVQLLQILQELPRIRRWQITTLQEYLESIVSRAQDHIAWSFSALDPSRRQLDLVSPHNVLGTVDLHVLQEGQDTFMLAGIDHGRLHQPKVGR